MKMQSEQIIRYSLQLVYLAELLRTKSITEYEYHRVKKQLMNDYHIISDILARRDKAP